MKFRFQDQRDWFFRERFGMFVHWGIYAVEGWHEQLQWRRGVPKAEYVRLAEHENIVAVKEASGNISQITDLMARTNGQLDLYSGNDDQIVPLLSVGGIGVISVLSNLLPRQTHDLVMAYLNGDTQTAMEMQFRYNDLIHSLFCQVNPIPVKAAMGYMGFCENAVRSPLYPMEGADAERLRQSMLNVGIEIR